MSPRDGAVRILDKHGRDQLSLVLKHRKHVSIKGMTLCGAEVNPRTWFDLGPAQSVFQLTCEPCAEETFKRGWVQVDGSIQQ